MRTNTFKDGKWLAESRHAHPQAARGVRSTASRLAIAAALLPSPIIAGQALAQDECGTGPTVTCAVDPANYPSGITYTNPPSLSLTFDPGVVVSPSPGTIGISTFINGDLSIDTRQGSVASTGDYAYGIQASTGGALTIRTADVSTTGAYAAAISGSNYGGGSVIIDTTPGSVSTQGIISPGIYASSDGPLTITTGAVTTSGIGSVAVDGTAYGAANPMVIDSTRGQVATTGDGGIGVYGYGYTGDISIKTGSITTQGTNAPAIATYQGSAVTIDSTAAAISTSGTGSAGIFTISSVASHAADILTGAITATGAGAFGVAAAALGTDSDGSGLTEGAGSITITSTAPILATGRDGGGIVAVS